MNTLPFLKPATTPEPGSIEWMIQDAQEKGLIYADERFIAWSDEVLGQPIGDLFRSIISNTKGWMKEYGVKAGKIRLDHLIAYSFVGVERPFIAKNEGGFSASVDAFNRSESFKEWFENRHNMSPSDENNIDVWMRDSLVVGANNEPMALYHGTGNEFESFRDMAWGSADRSLAQEYSELREFQGGVPRVIKMFMNIKNPFDADKLPKTLRVSDFFAELIKQSPGVDQELMASLKQAALSGARTEESGPHYGIHDFWNNLNSYFGSDGTKAIKQAYSAAGFDGIKFHESGVLTYGAFSNSQVMVVPEDNATPSNIHQGKAALELSEAADINEVIGQSSAFDLSYAKDGNSVRQYRVGDTTIVINAMTDEISLSSIRTPQRKRGNGSAKRALRALISQADAEGVTITLGASPLDSKTNINKLVSLYESMGFRLTGRSINPMGDPEMIRSPFGVNLEDINLPMDVLTNRNTYPPISSMTPSEATDLPLGSIRVAAYGDEDDRYVDVLRIVPVESLLLAEPEDNIKKTREYKQYVQWAREGRVAPSIQVNESDTGELIATNRRRVLAAHEVGIKTLKAWVSPMNPITGYPLKFGDLKQLAMSVDSIIESNTDMAPSPEAIQVFAYHGTPNGFTEFDTLPAFFTTDYDAAKSYADNQYAREDEEGMPRVLSATLTMNNPKVFNGQDVKAEFDDGNGDMDWYQFEMSFYELQEQGYDGVIVRGIEDYAGGSGSERKVKRYDQFAVFDSHQITIIDGNVSATSAKEKDFKDWFFESVMVNTDGSPMTLFHGTRPGNDIHEFEVRTNDGVYFTPDIHYAEGFTQGLFGDDIGQHGPMYPVHLSIKNPYVVKTEPESEEWERFCYRGLDKAELESQGYDSAILYLNDDLDQVIAFHPEQIRFTLTSTVNMEQPKALNISSEDTWMNNSKIINDDGSPKVVFHGSNQKFDFFDVKRKAQSTFNKASEEAFWFSDSQFVAREYAYYASKTVPSGIVDHEAEFERLTNLMSKAEKKGNWDDYEKYNLELEELDSNARYEPEGLGAIIYPVHLSLKNPMVLDVSADLSGFYARGGNFGIIEEAKRLGHDGVIFNNHNDTPTTGTVSTHYAVFNVEDIRFERQVNGLETLFIDADSEPYIDNTIKKAPTVNDNVPVKRVLTESSLMIEVGVTLPILAPIFESLLEKGRRAEKGGLVIVTSDDPNEIAAAIAAKTGLSFNDSLKAANSADANMGIRNDESGLTFLSSKVMSTQKAVASIMREITKTQLSDRILSEVIKLIEDKNRHHPKTRSFLERAESRIQESGHTGSANEKIAYIIEQAVMESILQPDRLNEHYNQIETQHNM